MSEEEKKCFVIMPFKPELNYFYLYLKKYIEERHDIKCSRADEHIYTKPFLDKINEFIREADVIIADCSGGNSNVFYELGIAHNQNKDVILITQDPPSEAPSSIRHYDLIQYKLDKHREFLDKIDNALENIFTERYNKLYECATNVYREFSDTKKVKVDIASREIFLSRVMNAKRTGELPPLDDRLKVEEFVLPRIIADSSDLRIMSAIMEWLSERGEEVVFEWETEREETN